MRSSKQKPLKALLEEQAIDPSQRPLQARKPSNAKLSSSFNRTGSETRRSFSSNPPVPPISATGNGITRSELSPRDQHIDAGKPLGVALMSCNELLSSYSRTGTQVSDAERELVWKLFTRVFPTQAQQIANPDDEQQPEVANAVATAAPSSVIVKSQPQPSSSVGSGGVGDKILEVFNSISAETSQSVEKTFSLLASGISRIATTELRGQIASLFIVEEGSVTNAESLSQSTPVASLGSKESVIVDVLESSALVNRRTVLGVPCVAQNGDVVGVIKVSCEVDTFPADLGPAVTNNLSLLARSTASMIQQLVSHRIASSTLQRTDSFMGELEGAFAAATTEDFPVADVVDRVSAVCRTAVRADHMLVLNDVTGEKGEAAKRGGDDVSVGLWQVASAAVQDCKLLLVDPQQSSEFFLTTADAKSIIAIPLFQKASNSSPNKRDTDSPLTPRGVFETSAGEAAYKATVVLLMRRSEPFTDDDVAVAQHLQRLSSPLVSLASQCILSEHRTAMLSKVLGVARSILEADVLHPEDLAAAVIERTKTLFGAEYVQLFLVNRERNELYFKPFNATAKPGCSIDNKTMDIEDGLPGLCVSKKATINLSDVREDSRRNAFDDLVGVKTSNALLEPIIRNDDVLAIALLGNKKNVDGSMAAFTETDEKLLALTCTFIGLALYSSGLVKFANEAAREAIELGRASSISGNLEHRNSQSGAMEFKVDESRSAEISSLSIAGIEATVFTKEFDIFAIHELDGPQAYDASVRVILSLFQKSKLMERFNCPERTMVNFLLACRSKYRNVPYHNFYHAVDVCQTTFTFLYEGNVSRHLTELECYVMLVTAIVHDLDHMGVNNSFHLKTDSPLGILSSASGNNSVLEVHHCNVALSILDNPKCNIFAGLNEVDLKSAYQGMIEAVLATDMARHQTLTNNFKENFSNRKDDEPFNSDQRLLVMQLCIKAADISNVTKNFDVSRKWGQRVTEEFYRQGDREKAKGHDILPMFDRSKNTELAKGQLGFIDFIAKPFFTVIVESLFTDMQWCLDRINANTMNWKAQLSNGTPPGSA